MKKLLFLFAGLMLACTVSAQEAEAQLRKFVVADLETRVPVRGAIVYTGDGYRDTTNYRGVCYVPATFDTLSVYKHGYLTERLLPRETKDSTFLIPNNKSIDQVTVWGKDPTEKLNEAVERWTQQDKLMGKDAGPATLFSFDLMGMFDKQARRDAKHLKKVNSSFQKMDHEDEDPIVAAYKRAMEQKRQEEEFQKAIAERKAQLQADTDAEIARRKADTEAAAKEVEQNEQADSD